MNSQANDPPDSALKTDKNDLDAEQVVVAYHERTKHHYHRFAASLGYLDWATQPDPFRRYDGAPLVRLPLPDAGRALPYWQLYVAGQRGAGPAFGRLHLALLSLRPLADRLESGSREPHGLCAPIPRAGTCTRRRDTRSCRRWTLSTTVPASTTTHRRSTVSSFERMLTPRSGRR